MGIHNMIIRNTYDDYTLLFVPGQDLSGKYGQVFSYEILEYYVKGSAVIRKRLSDTAVDCLHASQKQAHMHAERIGLLNALAAAGQWVSIYYGWRPNLPDEGDNHLIELAVAGNAQAVVTHNIKDSRRGQLIWPNLRILTPAACLEQLP